MPKIENIIIHCSDSEFGNVNLIRKWHLEKGWKDIGYHFVILNGKVGSNIFFAALNGSIECGRDLDNDNIIEPNEIGAHALGYNAIAIGICMIGKNKFTGQQMTSLSKLVSELQTKHDLQEDAILGHCETESGKEQGKTCPNIDMNHFRKMLAIEKQFINPPRFG